MKKTVGISKFDIHWQIQRIRLKRLASLDEKLNSVTNFFLLNKTIAMQERVLNYLEGLSMAYKGEERKKCLDVREQLTMVIVLDINNCSHDFTVYSEMELNQLLKDLMIRAKKWLKNGYRNEELLNFIHKLAKYLEDEKSIKKLDVWIKYSFTITNTHKFFF